MLSVQVTIDGKLLNESGKLTPDARQAVSNALGRIAKDFKNLTRRRIIESMPVGRLYRRKSGAGFRRFHRASAVGQRPAIDSGSLLNAIDDKRINEMQVDVFVARKLNVRSNAYTDEYAERLQSEMKRRIMDNLDAEQARIAARTEMERTIARIVNA
jgi:hypothetical protein